MRMESWWYFWRVAEEVDVHARTILRAHMWARRKLYERLAYRPTEPFRARATTVLIPFNIRSIGILHHERFTDQKAEAALEPPRKPLAETNCTPARGVRRAP